MHYDAQKAIFSPIPTTTTNECVYALEKSSPHVAFVSLPSHRGLTMILIVIKTIRRFSEDKLFNTEPGSLRFSPLMALLVLRVEILQSSWWKFCTKTFQHSLAIQKSCFREEKSSCMCDALANRPCVVCPERYIATVFNRLARNKFERKISLPSLRVAKES